MASPRFPHLALYLQDLEAKDSHGARFEETPGGDYPCPLNLDFDFSHIAACVDAFKGKPYPSQIQACP